MKARIFLKNFFKSSFCYILAVAIIINAGIFLPASAQVVLPTGRDEEFSQNDITFYNPGGSLKDCVHQGSGGTLEGNSLLEKIWNYITNLNIDGLSNNPSAISGIIANMWVETGGTFNPFIQNSGGCTGIIQWCGLNSYNSDFRDAMSAQGFDQYYGKKVEDVDPQIVDDALYLQLDIIFTKNLPKAVNANSFIQHLNTPENKTGVSGARAYSDLFLVVTENGFGGSDTIEDGGVRAIAKSKTYQAAASRRSHAEEIYNTYGTKAGNTSNSSSNEENNNNEPTSGTSETSGEQSGSSGSGVSWGSDGFISGGLAGYTKEVPPSGWSNETENRSFTTSGPNKILLHSTEGQTAGLAAYPSGNHFAPHFTLDAVNKKVSQHYSINVASNAIKSVDQEGPVQIELVGFSQGHTDNKYSLFNWSDEDWDYVAVVLTAIAEKTGIPLTSSVDWSSPKRFSSAESFKSYSGILGHMHAYNNDHVDPGNIWSMLSAALARNPNASKFHGGQTSGGGSSNEVCPSTSSGGGGDSASLTEGGFQSVSEAESAVMAEYKAITPRKYGVSAEGDAQLKKYHISDVNCKSGTDLENCVAFSTWFVNRFTGKEVEHLGNGSNVVSTLINKYGFSDEGTTPKVYSIFSVANGKTMCGNVLCGHTGVVLGINKTTNKIIIGEAGCSDASFTGVHEYDLSKFTSGAYTYAYSNVNIGN